MEIFVYGNCIGKNSMSMKIVEKMFIRIALDN